MNQMNAKRIAKALLGSVTDRTQIYLSLMCHLRERGHSKLATLVSYRLQRYGVHISAKAVVPGSVVLPHPAGIVVGSGVIIRDNVRIYQNVTLGGARVGDHGAQNYPEIGEGTTIFAGAVIVGRVRIGSNCVVAANAVVRSDVPDNCTVAGIPARIITSSNSATPNIKGK